MHNSTCPRVYPHMTYKLALLSPFLPAIDSGGVDAKNPSDDFTCQPEPRNLIAKSQVTIAKLQVTGDTRPDPFGKKSAS